MDVIGELSEQVAAMAERLDRLNGSTLLILLVIIVVLLAGLIVIAAWRQHQQVTSNLATSIRSMDERTARRLDDVGAREMIQTQNLAAVSQSLSNVTTATGKLVEAQEASHRRMREADEKADRRHLELMTAIGGVERATMPETVRNLVAETVASAIRVERDVLTAEWRSFRAHIDALTLDGLRQRNQLAASLFALMTIGEQNDAPENPVSPPDSAGVDAAGDVAGGGTDQPAGVADGMGLDARA